MSFKQHHQCLRALGLEENYFVQMDGEWSDHFSRERGLSESGGDFGDVVFVTRNSDNKRLALKLFRNPLSNDERERIGLALHLSKTKCKQWPSTLVRYLGAVEFSQGEQKQALIMEPIDGITVAQAVEEGRVFSAHQSMCYLRDVLAALAFMHSNGLSHRDVHSGNILLTRDGKSAVLVDLDLVCRPRSTKPQCVRLCIGPVTAKSTPPDLWCSKDYAGKGIESERWFRGDVWGAAAAYTSFLMTDGNSFADTLPYSQTRDSSKCTLYDDPKMKAAFERSIERLGAFRRAGFAVVEQMLSLDWKKRPSAAKALQMLPACRDRSELSLPMTTEEYQTKVASGEIEQQTGSYEDPVFSNTH